MFVKIDNIDLFYKKAGSGKKVVLLHGWGGRADSFLPVFNYLSSKFEVYAIDFPGFGQSSIPDSVWGVKDYTELLHKFFNKMGIDKATLIGHSFGGRVSILFSATYPEMVEKVVLVDSAGIIPKRNWKYYYRVYKFKLLKKIYLILNRGTTEEKLERFYQKYGSKDYKNAGPLRQIFVKVVNEDLRGFLPKIKAPTLLVWGEEDKDTPLYMAKIMEKEIPDAGLVVFKGAGHFSYLDNINDFNIIVSNFLKGSE
ncbi:4,5:9,10-diseco-3-hydroxy-5,9,17-trioxoandrosta-1(10),2-diene-4-oate hydrolase [Caloramator mitchellensis]|uniref:4,5:9,10-diseco-3-hydroxy-5,9, 17-trioxoandrosta-1(10),2-diene-4-oate hydrolase n=1 Tax=Caloramator mitchellensis TaxID=908809 RepID=A0A0R3K4R5_CALMK|nr:alpha/beta hydrolase [Caloramator mitchellensis]KRQ87938.1 4,5:9,10-diseco-3-hydroxy-5,9,17-trioxoandrosta-1(10),2-diene-4-oate hydrolase [Caloramator mitchellensis]